ncbi:MAG: carboxypeptidase-like regulatory domain-containing protein, partial [Sediminibacterium sp.]|nr:carboxypeptidase-like regulatory domain-containing protein [Sediminibacterium sp.]
MGSSSAQVNNITISGLVKEKANNGPIAYVNIVVKNAKDSSFIAGTVSNEEGRFSIANIKPGNYSISYSYTGFMINQQPLLIGSLSAY